LSFSAPILVMGMVAMFCFSKSKTAASHLAAVFI
jgi:hypothetical protein